ncbi:MAG TPA: HoxN/HupN/NixA family nickel/cobalt transporter [Thermoplasmata archaeon]|nr:HoxN/HupN/NixA family nickel/cobalt transporter [Thermoplasmata archaeon]
MDAPSAKPIVLRPGERRFLALLFGAIAAVTVAAIALLLLFAREIPVAGATSFVALGLLVYTLGLRHGLDADHIAAIDNTTRKLLQEGKRPLTAGTWFSLGHSTIVVGLVVALVVAEQAVFGRIAELRSAGSIIGTSVSGFFLFLIGAVNLVVVFEIYRIFRGLRENRFGERELEEQLLKRGFLNRYFGRLFRVVRSPRQLYPIGVLFGLGFDTASEVALIAIALTVATTTTIPLYAVLVLPLLFTVGMVAVDTADCAAMTFAYGWAFRNPIRKIYYNLTITVISVLVAFVIGAVELLAVLAQELNLRGGVWSVLGTVDYETLGVAVVAVFLITWGVATAYYRYRRFDDLPFGTSSPKLPA